MSAETYDFIVVGAGSAGCVLANRLSRDPKNRVLVVEAGGRDNWIWFHIPVGYLYAIGNPRADWMFKTAPEPNLGGRSIAYPRGRVVGGSSAINAMIYMRGQAADYDGWRQLGLAGWGWDDVLPYFLRPGGPSRRPDRPAWGGRRMAGRAPARLLADPRRGARGRGRNRHSEDRRLQSGRQRRLRLFRGQSAPRPALERGDGVFEADPQAAEPASRDRRACGAHSVRRPPRRRLALQPARRQPRGASRARSHSRRGRDRLAAALGAFGRRRPGSSQGDRRLGRPCAAGGRRKSAGPSAAESHLWRHRRAHAQCRLSVAGQAGDDGARLWLSPARAADHGALAAWPVRQVLARLRHRQYRIPCPTAVARSFRRAHARLSGDNDQRLQPAAGEPRLDPCLERRSARRAGHPTELFVGSRRSAGCGGLHPAYAPPCRSARACALRAARAQARRKLAVGR